MFKLTTHTLMGYFISFNILTKHLRFCFAQRQRQLVIQLNFFLERRRWPIGRRVDGGGYCEYTRLKCAQHHPANSFVLARFGLVDRSASCQSHAVGLLLTWDRQDPGPNLSFFFKLKISHILFNPINALQSVVSL